MLDKGSFLFLCGLRLVDLRGTDFPPRLLIRPGIPSPFFVLQELLLANPQTTLVLNCFQRLSLGLR